MNTQPSTKNEIPAQIRVENLSYVYPDSKQALFNISFEVAEGEKLALIGGNGSGKSTLLLHLNGILRGEGKVFINGLEITDSTQARIRTLVGMIFQNPADQLFSSSVYSDVAFWPIHLGFKKDAVKERVMRALRTVHMEDSVKRNPFNLSGGEKKRVTIASVLSMDPKILALDEPTSGLDPHARTELIELLINMPQTMVIATHDLDMAAQVCSKAVLLDRGTVVAQGMTSEIITNTSLLIEAGLV
ncbi:MAG TPA: ABC transporter ATP-binding protein [Anaerolineaceae bacterium]|nr:ABC transporter ATP-binding protein [Anaerolineaceae bacterium]